MMALFAFAPLPSLSLSTSACTKQLFQQGKRELSKGRQCNLDYKLDQYLYIVEGKKMLTLCTGAIYGRINLSQLRIKQPSNLALSSLHLLSALLTRI